MSYYGGLRLSRVNAEKMTEQFACRAWLAISCRKEEYIFGTRVEEFV
jgi:hypothetical protein